MQREYTHAEFLLYKAQNLTQPLTSQLSHKQLSLLSTIKQLALLSQKDYCLSYHIPVKQNWINSDTWSGLIHKVVWEKYIIHKLQYAYN